MMKWIVGFGAIAIAITAIVLSVSILGEAGFFLIVFGGVIILVAPHVGEAIIIWFDERKWAREHPWPPANLSESDLETFRKHTRDD